MSDTFAKIQSDADRVSIMIRAKIILTQERNGMFGIVSKPLHNSIDECRSTCPFLNYMTHAINIGDKNFRRRYFIQEETWKNPSSKLAIASIAHRYSREYITKRHGELHS